MRFRRTVLWGLIFATYARASAAGELPLIPRPASVTAISGCSGPSLREPLRLERGTDPAALEILNERLSALRLPRIVQVSDRAIVALHALAGAPQSYRLIVRPRNISISAADSDGMFYGFVTLAQLIVNGAARLPCVTIVDRPALRWRALSDDVSRGPLPTMKYFRERIRTIATFKMNGYSPYMEHVFVAPDDALPAPLDGLTPRELHELAAYAQRFHVTLIPEQQTFAHMHNTLRVERYAPLSELPHGYLLAPANNGGDAYSNRMIGQELSAIGSHVAIPFFHIGSDEPSDLGRGASAQLVAGAGAGALFLAHVNAIAAPLAARGIRPLIWDDALVQHPELFERLPKSLIVVDWHYGAEATYRPFIDRVAAHRLEQFIAPGSLNWNEIYPDLGSAFERIDRFTSEGKAARVLGLFQTVWHDDGETLYEATWVPVLYAGASAWERASVPPQRFLQDFGSTFFALPPDSGDVRVSLEALRSARTLVAAACSDSTDYLFWSDAFDPSFLRRVGLKLDAAKLRLAAETAIDRSQRAAMPLHANAAAVMTLAARRYDLLGRNLQIAREARDYYEDGRAHADGAHDNLVFRGLFVSKYLFWEQRDALLQLEPLVRSAWDYESRIGHRASVLERYHAGARRAIERADLIDRETYEGYVAAKRLRPFDEVLGLTSVTP